MVTGYLKKVFEIGESDKKATCAKNAQAAEDGKTRRYKSCCPELIHGGG